MERLKCKSDSSKDSICGFKWMFAICWCTYKKNLQNDQVNMHLKTSDILFQENEPMHSVSCAIKYSRIRILLMQQTETCLQKPVFHEALGLHLKLYGCVLTKSFNLLTLNSLNVQIFDPRSMQICTPQDMRVSVFSGVEDTKRGTENAFLTLTNLLLI